MLINNTMRYEPHHIVEIGSPDDPFFYYFDYDERSYQINMEFQHFHSFREIHILLDPAANHFIEGTPYGISCFDIVLLRPSLLHRSEYFKGAPCKRLVIQFNFDEIPGALREEYEDILTVFDAELPIYRFEQDKLERLFAPLNDIMNATYGKKNFSRFYVHCRFMDFLNILSSIRYENIYRPKMPEGSQHKIFEIAAYIHNNYMNELSLTGLADQFYMSTYYLSHQFKEVTGFTLINYIQMTRIRNAQQMLLFSDRKITDIAAECGFTSFSQFNRIFKKFYGMSPREYKNKAPGNSGSMRVDLGFDNDYIYQ